MSFTEVEKAVEAAESIGKEVPQVIRGKVATGFAAAVLVILSAFVQLWEGVSYVAYIPVPGDVATICYGETQGVELGDRATKEECSDMLRVRLRGIYNAMAPTIKVPLEPWQMAAFADFTYNEGMGNWMRSRMLKDLSDARMAPWERITHACLEFTSRLPGGALRYDIADHRHLPGLAHRRAAEQKLCLM